jgi:hypothetical protein
VPIRDGGNPFIAAISLGGEWGCWTATTGGLIVPYGFNAGAEFGSASAGGRACRFDM